jgi:predicted nucleotidyltransferase
VSDESKTTPLEQIVKVLLDHKVEFLVIGGQAEFLFGGARPTIDVDICYKRDQQNLERLAAALRRMNVRLRGIKDDLPFVPDARTLQMGSNFTFTTSLGDLDLLGYVEPLGGYEQLLPNEESYSLGTMTVRTIGLEDLLKVKRHINRMKDQESIYQLLAIKRIREEKKSP